MIMATYYKSGKDDNKSDNNKDKVCLLLRRWRLVGHMSGHILDHRLNHMLNHRLDHILDYMIISIVTKVLQIKLDNC